MDEAQSHPSAMCAAFQVCDSHGWPSSSPNTRSSSPPTSHCSPPRRRWSLLLRIQASPRSSSLACGLPHTLLPRVPRVPHRCPAIEGSGIGTFLYVKDSSPIPDVLKFEYDNARAARTKLTKD